MSISRTDGQHLLDGVEEVQDHWKRNFTGFLADSLLEIAFVIDCLFQSRPEIFDRPMEGDARWVGYFRN